MLHRCTKHKYEGGQALGSQPRPTLGEHELHRRVQLDQRDVAIRIDVDAAKRSLECLVPRFHNDSESLQRSAHISKLPFRKVHEVGAHLYQRPDPLSVSSQHSFSAVPARVPLTSPQNRPRFSEPAKRRTQPSLRSPCTLNPRRRSRSRSRARCPWVPLCLYSDSQFTPRGSSSSARSTDSTGACCSAGGYYAREFDLEAAALVT